MRSLRWALPALLATMPLAATAQDDAVAARTRVGIGASVNMGGVGLLGVESGIAFTPIGMMNLHLPILTAGGLRIEPEFGYFNYSSSNSFAESSTTALRLGVGVAWAWEPLERTSLYVGPKIGLSFRSTDYDQDEGGFDVLEDDDATDFWIGAAVGGEGFVTEGFSLGLEAQLNYINFGGDDDQSAVSTNALFFGRFYFN